MILLYKWRLVRKYSYWVTTLLILFSLVLFYHAVWSENSITILVVIAIFGVLFSMNEVV